MAKRGGVDAWKKKSWFSLVSPKIFNEVVVGETPGEKPSQVLGRVIDISLRDLTHEAKKAQVKMLLQVSKIEGQKAHTELKGFTVDAGYLKRVVRRHLSKIEITQFIVSKEGFKTKIKTIIVTARKAHKKQESGIRKVVVEEIQAMENKKTIEQLVNEALFTNFCMKLFNKAKKIVPVKRVEIVTVLKMPVKSSAEEIKPAQ